MNTVDLHMHSTHSDGTCSPFELVQLAEKRGLRAIAITDHDTLSHIKETLEIGSVMNMEVIAGVEVSADFTGGTMHILGYFVDPSSDELFDMLERFRTARADRNPKIIKKLNELGLPIAYEEVVREASGGPIGRPHIARVLVKKGLVSNFQEVFDKYLTKGGPAYIDRVRFSAEKIISVIHKAQGLAVLAHPKQLKIEDNNKLDALVEKLTQSGLDGIEVYSSCHSKKESQRYASLAEKYNLLISGGSDFHGMNKEHIEMGFTGVDVELSYDIVLEMHKKQYRMIVQHRLR